MLCRTNMIIQCFLFTFSFILYLLPICCFRSEPNVTSGAFKTSIVSAEDCATHDRPFLKTLPMLFYPYVQNVHGKNTLSGNLTVLKDIKDVRIKVNSFSFQNDKWRQYHSFNNLDCHGTMLRFTFGALKVKYDKKKCMFFKGFYSFRNIDVNQLQHLWVSAMPYGRVLWRVEAYTNGGLFICKEFDTTTEIAYP